MCFIIVSRFVLRGACFEWKNARLQGSMCKKLLLAILGIMLKSKLGLGIIAWPPEHPDILVLQLKSVCGATVLDEYSQQ